MFQVIPPRPVQTHVLEHHVAVADPFRIFVHVKPLNGLERRAELFLEPSCPLVIGLRRVVLHAGEHLHPRQQDVPFKIADGLFNGAERACENDGNSHSGNSNTDAI